MTRTHAALLVLGLVMVVGVAGCTSGSATTTTAPVPTTTAPNPTETDPRPTATVAPPPLPEGFALVEATTSQLMLAIPLDLTVIDVAKLAGDPNMQALLEQFAQQSGITMETLYASIAQVDIMAMDAAGNNISLIPPIRSGMPRLSDIQPVLEQMGALNITSQDRTTPLGPALVVSYVQTLGGRTQNQVQVYALVAPLSVAVVTLNAVTWTPERLAEVVDVVVSTLQPA